MSLVNYRPSESPVAQMSVVAGLVASTAQALSLSFQEKSVLLRICQSFGSSVTYDVYRSVDGVVDSDPMVSGVSDAFYLSVVLGQENSILVLSLQADGYYPILLTVSYLYEKDLLFISQVGATGEMKYKMFNSTELSQNLDYTIDLFTAVPDLSIDTLPEVIDFLSGFVTTDNLKQYIADQVDIFEIVQGPGNSTTAVMSQNAVTEELRKKASMESVTESISAHNTSTTAHADIRELLNTCVGLPAYDSSSYKITFTTLAGATVEIDLPIEQLALRYNAETDSIEFDNADGTTTSIPVSAFVKEYVGSIGDRIQVSIDENNVIHAAVLKNSIDWDCLSFELQERINDHVTSADFATKAVRTDIAQTLTTAQQAQALANVGMKVYVTDSSFLGSTLSAEEIEEVSVSKVLLFTDTGDLFLFGSQDSNRISFYRFSSFIYVNEVRISKLSGFVSGPSSYGYRDKDALHFTAQNPALTSAQQDVALSNIGLKWVNVPYSLLNTTLDDATYAKIKNANGLILTDASSEYYGPSEFICSANNKDGVKVFAGLNLANTSAYIILQVNHNLTNVRYARTYDGAVPYDAFKALTDTQKQQALSNIGLPLVHVDYSLIGSTLDDSTYNKLLTAKGVFLENVPDGNNAPSLYFVGSSDTVTTVFVSEFNARVWFVLTLSHTSKKLSLVSTGYATDVVRYGEGQNLTDVQKQQARSNIGVKSADELLADDDFIAQLKTKLGIA